jgi:hypothetical protein
MCHLFLEAPPRPSRNTASSAGALLAIAAGGAVFDDIHRHLNAIAPAHAVIAAPARAAAAPGIAAQWPPGSRSPLWSSRC